MTATVTNQENNQYKNVNGISVLADRDFGAIELSLVVSGQKIGCFLDLKEAEKLSESLKIAIVKMMMDDGCSCHQTDE